MLFLYNRLIVYIGLRAVLLTHLISHSVYLLSLTAVTYKRVSNFTQLPDLLGYSFVCLSVDVPQNQLGSQLSKPTSDK